MELCCQARRYGRVDAPLPEDTWRRFEHSQRKAPGQRIRGCDVHIHAKTNGNMQRQCEQRADVDVFTAEDAGEEAPVGPPLQGHEDVRVGGVYELPLDVVGHHMDVRPPSHQRASTSAAAWRRLGARGWALSTDIHAYTSRHTVPPKAIYHRERNCYRPGKIMGELYSATVAITVTKNILN
eukprot:1012883-Amphidinium_carterae.1